MKLKGLISFCALAVLFTYSATAQSTTLLADTAFVTDIGYGGAPASCKANGMTYNSLDMDRAQNAWVADDFTVPGGMQWSLDTAILYGYQYGTGAATSPFTLCHLLILDGPPAAGGAIIWGDTSTNLLGSTGFTGIYKVDTFAADSGLLSTKRAIMYLKLNIPDAPQLAPGTYWLAWQAACATNVNLATCPYKVLPGRINPPGQNARMYINGSWQYAIYNGDTIGLNMQLKGVSSPLDVPNVINPVAGDALYQNFPNPFSGNTSITIHLEQSEQIRLTVCNVIGQRVATLIDGVANAGVHTLMFNSAKLPGGTYFCRLLTPAGTIDKRMVLIK